MNDGFSLFPNASFPVYTLSTAGGPGSAGHTPATTMATRLPAGDRAVWTPVLTSMRPSRAGRRPARPWDHREARWHAPGDLTRQAPVPVHRCAYIPGLIGTQSINGAGPNTPWGEFNPIPRGPGQVKSCGPGESPQADVPDRARARLRLEPANSLRHEGAWDLGCCWSRWLEVGARSRPRWSRTRWDSMFHPSPGSARELLLREPGDKGGNLGPRILVGPSWLRSTIVVSRSADAALHRRPGVIGVRRTTVGPHGRRHELRAIGSARRCPVASHRVCLRPLAGGRRAGVELGGTSPMLGR